MHSDDAKGAVDQVVNDGRIEIVLLLNAGLCSAIDKHDLQRDRVNCAHSRCMAPVCGGEVKSFGVSNKSIVDAGRKTPVLNANIPLNLWRIDAKTSEDVGTL